MASVGLAVTATEGHDSCLEIALAPVIKIPDYLLWSREVAVADKLSIDHWINYAASF